MKKSHYLNIALSSISIFALLIIFSASLNVTWSSEKIFTECQDEEITYDSFSPYCVLIFDRNKTLRTDREIWIVKSANHNYGHLIQYPYPTNYWDKNIYETTETEWTEEGLNLKIKDLSIFVPKHYFIGGR